MDKIIFMCWKCKSDIKDEIITRSSECSVCHADLHSCKNCSFYSPGSHFDCHESVSELVTEKERGNFCDYFKVRREWGGSSSLEQSASLARQKFNSLFSV